MKLSARMLGIVCSAAIFFGTASSKGEVIQAFAASPATFTLVDNFEGSAGPLSGRFGIWYSNGGEVTNDPPGAGNQVVLFAGTGDRGSHVPATITNGQTGTLFFRMRVDNDNADPGAPVLNYSIGMADVAVSGNGAFGDYEVQLNQNRDAGNLLPNSDTTRVGVRRPGFYFGPRRLAGLAVAGPCHTEGFAIL